MRVFSRLWGKTRNLPEPAPIAKGPLIVVCPMCNKSFTLIMGKAIKASVLCPCGTDLDISRKGNELEIKCR